MPYKVVGKCVHKVNADGSVGDTVPGGCHKSPEEAQRHARALYANVKEGVAEMSLVVTKASFDKAELDPNKKRRIMMVNSDTAPDLYEESMSLELFNDFCHRIENKTPIPEEFKSSVCEDFWCGGMPYLSVAHYPAGREGKNVPGMPESVYVDGKMLKSKAFLYDNELGRRLFDSLCADLEKRSQGIENEPVRVSIGFLDLEHEHIFEGKTVTFTRTERGQVCPLCKDGHGSKIYKKGHLVHLAATRKPVNPRTEMGLEEKSMGEIITKQDDAASIVGDDLAKELEAKSLVDDVLVVKGVDGAGTMPADIPEGVDDGLQNSEKPMPFASCYDPNTDSFDQKCIDASMRGFMAAIRNEMNTVKSDTVEQKLVDGVLKSLEQLQGTKPVVEESMETIVKAKDEKESEKETEAEAKDPQAEEKEKMDKMHKSNLDTTFESLKSLLATNPTAEAVQNAFNALGQEVEKSYTPPAPSATDIAEIVRSAVEAAVNPLKIELATLKAQGNNFVANSANAHPVSRALSLKPAELLQKSQAQVPSGRKLTQVEKIARSSVVGKAVDDYGNPVG